MPDPVMKFQIIARDPEAAGRFYTSLFRWKIDTANQMGYREITAGDEGIDGGIWPAGADGENMVQLFVKVDNVEDSITRAVKLGARVIVPRSALPDGDTIAILLDPLGIAFGLMESSK